VTPNCSITRVDQDVYHVYNIDETGLFFKVLLNCRYMKKSELETAHGTKLMKAKN
jgi:hypothetical protein